MTGHELRELRQTAGLLGRELAEMLEVTLTTVYRWERGERKISASMAKLIAMELERYSSSGGSGRPGRRG